MANWIPSSLPWNSSSASSQQYSQGQPATSTWTSTVSSRFATFTKFLTRDSEEDDPEDEDCSHVSNVLRAYYIEKGRPFPPWLPPDPKRPQKQPQMPPPQAQYGQYGQYGQYDNMYNNQQGYQPHGRSGSGGGLSDLFDSRPQQPLPQAQSLRVPRPGVQPTRSYENGGAPRPTDPYPPQTSQSNLSARPLPSQRAGSFQNQNPAGAGAPVMGSRDRLKVSLRAGGSGRNSPAPNQSNQNPNVDSSRYAPGQGSDHRGAPMTSAAQPWTSTGNYDNYGGGRDNRGYGNTAYQQRPGGPR